MSDEDFKRLYKKVLNEWSIVLMKTILQFDLETINYRPSEYSYSAGEMGIHVFQMVYMYSYAVKHGSFVEENFSNVILEDPISPQSIAQYAQDVIKFAKSVIQDITKEQMEKEVTYGGFKEIGVSFGQVWDDWSMSVHESLDKMLEDILHHRAQLMTYLRLNEKQLPFIYDYTPIE